MEWDELSRKHDETCGIDMSDSNYRVGGVRVHRLRDGFCSVGLEGAGALEGRKQAVDGVGAAFRAVLFVGPGARRGGAHPGAICDDSQQDFRESFRMCRQQFWLSALAYQVLAEEAPIPEPPVVIR